MVTNNSSGTYIVPTINNEVTMPSQPAFLEILNGDEDDVTGNGTTYTIGTNNGYTEIFDQNADFAGTTFTAPVTGRYDLVGTTFTDQVGGATGNTFLLVTSNRSYRGDGLAGYVTTVADMDAADTAYLTITVSGLGGDTADLLATGGAGDNLTFFTGFLAV